MFKNKIFHSIIFWISISAASLFSLSVAVFYIVNTQKIHEYIAIKYPPKDPHAISFEANDFLGEFNPITTSERPTTKTAEIHIKTDTSNLISTTEQRIDFQKLWNEFKLETAILDAIPS